MPLNSAFDIEKFLEILSEQVSEKVQLGTPAQDAENEEFTRWSIRQISPTLTPAAIEDARIICKAGNPISEITAAWIDESVGTCYLIQAEYRRPTLGKGSRLLPPTFDVMPGQLLHDGFDKVRNQYAAGMTAGSAKIIQVTALYQRAIQQRMNIRLFVIISGWPSSHLERAVEQLETQFIQDRITFTKHHAETYDVATLKSSPASNAPGLIPNVTS